MRFFIPQYMSNNKEKGTQWKELLHSALTDLKQLLHEDGVVSSYEIHSSGLVQSLLAMLSTSAWDQGVNALKRSKMQKHRIHIFRNVFKVRFSSIFRTSVAVDCITLVLPLF